MKRGSGRFFYLFGASMIASAAMATSAAAQDQPGQAGQPQTQAQDPFDPIVQPQTGQDETTIYVTARRRSELLQDVPAAITAFTNETIEAAGIERPLDFVNLTSNVTLVETQNAGNAFIVIRGITQARNSDRRLR